MIVVKREGLKPNLENLQSTSEHSVKILPRYFGADFLEVVKKNKKFQRLHGIGKPGKPAHSF